MEKMWLKKSLKRVVSAIPLFILFIIISILFTSISLFTSYTNFKSFIHKEKISIGIVGMNDTENIDGQEIDSNILYNLLNSMKSVKDNLNIIPMNKDEAYKKLEAGNISAIIKLPSDFFTSIIDGRNKSATIITTKKRPLESIIINSLIQSLSDILSKSQAYIYASSDELNRLNLSTAYDSKLNYSLNYNFIMSTLNREHEFNVYNLYDKKIDLILISSNILMFVSICSMGLFRLISEEKKELWQRLKISHFSKSFACICEIIKCFIMFIIVFLILSIILNIFYKLNTEKIYFIFIITFSIFLIFSSILGLANNSYSLIPYIFLVGYLCNFLGGGVVPTIFLPKQLLKYNIFATLSSQISYILDDRMDLLNINFIYTIFIISFMIFFSIYRLRKVNV